MVVPLLTFLLTFALTSPSEAPSDTTRERIETITLAGSGTAGTVTTLPEFMQGSPTTYVFGSGACKKYKLGARTLEQLFVAMRTGSLLDISADTVERGGEQTRCIRSVTFFATSAAPSP